MAKHVYVWRSPMQKVLLLEELLQMWLSTSQYSLLISSLPFFVSPSLAKILNIRNHLLLRSFFLAGAKVPERVSVYIRNTAVHRYGRSGVNISPRHHRRDCRWLGFEPLREAPTPTVTHTLRRSFFSLVFICERPISKAFDKHVWDFRIFELLRSSRS